MNMLLKSIKFDVVLFVTVALAGCASSGNVVRCRGQLQPINMPASGASQQAAPIGGSRSEPGKADE